MITVYHMPRSRSQRVLWALEEMGLAYETRPCTVLDVGDELLALNPGGTIPVMVDGEVVLTESVAMLQHLAETYGPTDLAPPPGDPARADFLQYLMFGEAGLASPLNVVMRARFSGDPAAMDSWPIRYVLDAYVKRLGVVARRLEDHPFLAGDRFTLADISVGWTIGIATAAFGLKARTPEHVLRWSKGLTQRPAYQRAVAR